ncbi:2'-5' RNA ligase family protein [Nonomuraea rhizosphaerae]|uniref:2'-5' RNA ligase family protein n=1 Tax=Nonomuraea rhizosphaerae TaxID=2665663 RepID=UPI001C5DB390|nr:2'-5' RNA ligase family protein [Nonomuraea rhizosphaerae]
MGRYPAGRTALVVPVPEAEPVVGPWRAALDPSSPYGVPPHVTVMYPFLPSGEAGRAALGELFAGFAAFDVVFARCVRLGGLLYLEPSPAEPFARLTGAVTARWPRAIPYGGKHGEALPHLSIGYDGGEARFDEASAAIEPGLPVRSRVTTVRLVEFDGTTWRTVEDFPLSAA